MAHPQKLVIRACALFWQCTVNCVRPVSDEKSVNVPTVLSEPVVQSTSTTSIYVVQDEALIIQEPVNLENTL